MYYNAQDADFLMSIVDHPHSDYDDALDGYPNYGIDVDPATGVPKLTVQFQRADSDELIVGTWRLSLMSLVVTGRPEGEAPSE